MWVSLFPPVLLGLHPHHFCQRQQKHMLLILWSRVRYQPAREAVQSSLNPTEDAPTYLPSLLRSGMSYGQGPHVEESQKSDQCNFGSATQDSSLYSQICHYVARSSELGAGRRKLKRWFLLNLEGWSALACGRVSVKPSFTLWKLLQTTESPKYLTWLGWGANTNGQSLGIIL